MFKFSLMCFPFSFGTVAVSAAWLGCIPVQFSTNISVLSTTYICRSERLEWLSLHTLWRDNSWPFSFHSCLIWFWTIFFAQSVRFGFMVYANFDVLLELKCASFSEGLCQDLWNICSLTPGWHPKRSAHVWILICILFCFLFFRYCNYFIARVSMPCALILWLWLKDKAGVFSDSMYPCH